MFPGLEDPTPGTKGCQGRVVVDPVLLPQTCSMEKPAVYQRDGAIGLRHCGLRNLVTWGGGLMPAARDLASNDFYPLFAVVTGWLGWRLKCHQTVLFEVGTLDTRIREKALYSGDLGISRLKTYLGELEFVDFAQI